MRQLIPIQISLLRQFKTQSLLDVFALFFKSYAYVLNFKTPNKGALRLLLERMSLILCMLCREGVREYLHGEPVSSPLHTEQLLVEDVSRPLLVSECDHHFRNTVSFLFLISIHTTFVTLIACKNPSH